MKNNKNKIVKLSPSEKIFYVIIVMFVGVIALTMLYPLTFIFSASISSPDAVMSGKVLLWPIDITLKGYETVINNKNILLGFRNSLFYMVVGTAINLVMTTLAAYPLSRKNLPYKGAIMFLFTFTMIFSAGMIPGYLLMRDLHLLNTAWVMILPGAISTYNMIVMRTYFMTNIPDELLEASKLDGCSDYIFLIKVVLPLSKSIIAVIIMYYAVAHWNSYFNAFLYLSNDKLYPLQLFLRDILISNQMASVEVDTLNGNVGVEYILKYALIVVATIPMLIMYPYVQKHFKKGVMIGSVKG